MTRPTFFRNPPRIALTTLALCCAALCQAGTLTPTPLWQNDNIYIGYEHFVDHVVLDGQTYFRMTQDDHSALWRTDGTQEATRVIYPRDLISKPLVADQKIWFLVDHAGLPTQLIAFDPQTNTTNVALTLADSINTSRQFLHGTTLYFNDDQALYRIDLTAPATPTYVADAGWWIVTGDYLLTQTPDTFAFSIHNLITQNVYTQARTSLLVITEMGGLIYFLQAPDVFSNRVLYRSNGSAAGTVTVLDTAQHPAIQNIEELVTADSNHLYLRIRYTRPDTSSTQTQMISLDGTPDAYELLPVPVKSGFPSAMRLATAAPDDRGVYYLTPEHAPVYSDGTAAGTRQLDGGTRLRSPDTVHSMAWGDRTILNYVPAAQGRPSTVYTTDNTFDGTEAVYLNHTTPLNVYRPLMVIGDQALVVVRYNNRGLGEERDNLALLNLNTGNLDEFKTSHQFIKHGTPLTTQGYGDDLFAYHEENSGGPTWLAANWKQRALTTFLQRYDSDLTEIDGTLYLTRRVLFGDPLLIETWNPANRTFTTLANFDIDDHPGRLAHLFRKGNRLGFRHRDTFYVHQIGDAEPSPLFTFLGATPFAAHVLNQRLLVLDTALYVTNLEQHEVIALPGTIVTDTVLKTDTALVFVLQTAADRYEVHRSDGTTAGTRLVCRLPAGTRPIELTAFGEQVAVIAQSESARSLWLSANGSNDAVALDAWDTEPSPMPLGATAVRDGMLFYVKTDRQNGAEIWRSNGTAAGTALFADLAQGNLSSFPEGLLADETRLLFRAFTDATGWTLWQTDGTNPPTPLLDPEQVPATGFRALAGRDGLTYVTSTENDLWQIAEDVQLEILVDGDACNNGGSFTAEVGAFLPDAVYTWQVTAGTLLSGQGSNAIRFRPDGEGAVTLSLNVVEGDYNLNATRQVNVDGAAPPQPSAVKGPTEVCSYSFAVAYAIDAVATADSYEWETPAGELQITDEPTLLLDFGVTAGTLRVRARNGCGVSEWQSLAISLGDSSTAGDAGPDQSSCTTSITLNAVATGGEQWIVLSGFGGSFSNNSDPAAVFTGVPGQTYLLAWQRNRTGCSPVSDQVVVTFLDGYQPASAGDDQRVCEDTTFLEAVPANWGTGTWTILSGEGGVLTDAGDPATRFSGLPGQVYQLQWRVAGTPCGASSDTVTIEFFDLVGFEPSPVCIALDAVLPLAVPSLDPIGFWGIVTGPDLSDNQIENRHSPTTNFRPSRVGDYEIRWNPIASACSQQRWTYRVTVKDERALFEDEVFAGTPNSGVTYLGTFDGRLVYFENNGGVALKANLGGHIETLLRLDSLPAETDIVRFEDQVVFVANNERVLFRSNGTIAGTYRLNTPAVSAVRHLTAAAQGVFFYATSGGQNLLPFFSDGRDTEALVDPAGRATAFTDYPALWGFHPARHGGTLFFINNGSDAVELWLTDGTRAGTTRVTAYDAPSGTGAEDAAVLSGIPVLVYRFGDDLHTSLGDEQTTNLVYSGEFFYRGTFDNHVAITTGPGGRLHEIGTDGEFQALNIIFDRDHNNDETVHGRIGKGWLIELADGTHQIHSEDLATQDIIGPGSVLGSRDGAWLTLDLANVALRSVARDDRGTNSNRLSSTYLLTAAVPVLTDSFIYFWELHNDTLSLYRSTGRSTELAYSLPTGGAAVNSLWMRTAGEVLVFVLRLEGGPQKAYAVRGGCVEALETDVDQDAAFTVLHDGDGELVIADQGQTSGLYLWRFSKAFANQVLDENFHQALLAAADQNQDGVLTRAEAATIINLDLRNHNIQHLAGLRFLPNLRVLDVRHNLISNLSPLLNHHNFGSEAGHFADVRYNPLTRGRCYAVDALRARFAEGRLLITPNLAPSGWRYVDWPEATVLDLLNPGLRESDLICHPLR